LRNKITSLGIFSINVVNLDNSVLIEEEFSILAAHASAETEQELI